MKVAVPSILKREYYSHAEATYLRRYTHNPATLRAIFHEPIAARYAKYDRECLKTFLKIPQYAIVRSKRRIPESARYVIKLTEHTYAVCDNEEATRFVEYIKERYDALLASKSVKRRQQILHAFPVSTILRDVQKLRIAESSEYRYLKTLIPSSHLKLLLECGVAVRITIDWAWPKKSFIFLSPLLSS